MVEFDGIEHALDRLEKDRSFRRLVAALSEGTIPQDEADPAFREYQRYVHELEAFTEAPEVMREVLAEPLLKIWFFRVFGYVGELRFSVMPSVWLRDLPLLDIGRDAHLGYGMMLGTSQIDPAAGTIELRQIAIGARTFFNQHSIVEGGTRIGDDCCVGIRAMIGGRCRIDPGCEIGDFVRIGADAMVGGGARIGHGALIGRAAIVDPGLVVEEGGEVPAHHRLTAGGLFPRPHRRLAA